MGHFIKNLEEGGQRIPTLTLEKASKKNLMKRMETLKSLPDSLRTTGQLMERLMNHSKMMKMAKILGSEINLTILRVELLSSLMKPKLSSRTLWESIARKNFSRLILR